jgi:murein tripeptide amidase MpaA
MKAFPMSEIRKVFPQSLSLMQREIDSINECIKRALNRKERSIAYQFNRLLYSKEIDIFFEIYEKEGYFIEISTDFCELPRLIIKW